MLHIKKTAFICFLFLLHVQLFAQYAADTNDKLVALEKQRFSAMIQKDTAFLKKYISDDLVYIHSNGLVQNKNEFISSIKKGSIVYTIIDVKEQAIRYYKKSAVITGKIRVNGLLEGNNFDVNLLYTAVYVKKNTWKLVTYQSLKMLPK